MRRIAITLGVKDKAVLRAFIDQKPAEGKKLYTDGKTLDGLWIGGNGVAEWVNGKIQLNELGSRSGQALHRLIKKMAAPFDIKSFDEVEQGVKKYIDFLTDTAEKTFKKHYPNLNPPRYDYNKGGRFYRIFQEDSSGVSKSAVAFVDKATGDIYKSASWSKPAKHARGNVKDDASWRGHTEHGPYYLKGAVEELLKIAKELSPVQKADIREDLILKAIKKLAKKYKVGPLAPMRIDAMGEITMLQRMKNPIEYVSEEKIDERLTNLAKKYDKYHGQVSSRWIKMNHFTWERMLKDIGLLKLPKEVTSSTIVKELIQIAKDLTAPEAYAKAWVWLDKAMKKLHQVLENHKKEQKKNPKDWGSVGDINSIASELEDLGKRFQ